MLRPLLKYKLVSAIGIVLLNMGTLYFLVAPQNPDIILSIGAIITGLFLALWLVIFVDMVVNPLYNKTFWILSILFLPPVAMVSYLYKRKVVKNIHFN